MDRGKQLENNVDKFLKKEGLYTLTPIEREPEGYFSHAGCEICNDGLGNNVYQCNGYNETTKEIQEGYQVCHECLHYMANGMAYDDSYNIKI